MFQTSAFSMKSLHVATMINLCGGCSEYCEYCEYSEYCEFFPLKCSNCIFVKIFAGCNNDQPLWRLLRPQRRAREHPGTLITWFCLRWFCFDSFAIHTWSELIEKESHSNWPQSNCQSNVFSYLTSILIIVRVVEGYGGFEPTIASIPQRSPGSN